MRGELAATRRASALRGARVPARIVAESRVLAAIGRLRGHAVRLTDKFGGVGGVARRALKLAREEGWQGLAGRLKRLSATPPAIYRATSVSNRGINLIGHPYGALGMGEHVRKSAHAMLAAGVPIALKNTFEQLGDHGDKFPELGLEAYLCRDNPHAASLFHLNADEMKLARAHLGEAFFKGRYNIGYPAWELSIFPDEWLPALEVYQELWAPSRFIQQSLASKVNLPVVWMPLAVDFPQTVPLSRKALGLPEGRFLFLFYFDFQSYSARKNPQAVLDAYRIAFGASRRADVSLVIKLNGTQARPREYEAFKDSIAPIRDRLVLMDRVLTDREVRSLVANCDCFVSLHRSEGFGRGMAEALFYEKPVIATGYSGNTDFTHPDNSLLVDYTLVPLKQGEYPFWERQKWAAPDVEHAASHMRWVIENPAAAAQMALRGAQYVRTHHSYRAVGERYKRRLVKLGLL